MAYDSVLMAELIKKLSVAMKGVADCSSERDFYLKLIALNAKVFGSTVPDILSDTDRQTILALVREISSDRPSAIARMPVSNGNGAH